MRHRTSPQQSQINAEVEARRAIAYQKVLDERHEREAREAQSLVEDRLGGEVLYVEDNAYQVGGGEVLRSY